MDKTQGLQLRDIHLPSDPGYWPLAPGWWVLIILLLIVAYFALKKLSKIRHRKHTIAQLQHNLGQLREAYNTHKSKPRLAADISDLLKRFVRHVLKDSQAISLTGRDWIAYLNNLVGSDIFDEFEIELTQAQYLPQVDFDVSKLVAQVKNFFPMALNNYVNTTTKTHSEGESHA